MKIVKTATEIIIAAVVIAMAMAVTMSINVNKNVNKLKITSNNEITQRLSTLIGTVLKSPAQATYTGKVKNP